MSEGTEKEEALALMKGLLVGVAISFVVWVGVAALTFWFITR